MFKLNYFIQLIYIALNNTSLFKGKYIHIYEKKTKYILRLFILFKILNQFSSNLNITFEFILKKFNFTLKNFLSFNPVLKFEF